MSLKKIVTAEMPDIQTVLSQLSEQCRTVEELRHYFRLNRIKGRTAGFTDCLLANYLSQETGERWGVDHECAVKVRDDFVERVDLPEVLQGFAHNFDEGHYPELVSEDDWCFWKNRNGERYEGS